MKKLIASFLILIIALFTLASCSREKDDDTVIRVGYINGPTGMGMAKMINDNTDGTKYEFTFFKTPAEAKDAFIAGNIDIACLSTDVAANTFKVEDNTTVLAINTLSALFLVSDSDTNITAFDKANLDGKKIYTLAQGTPYEVVKALLEKYEIDAEVVTSVNGATINSADNLKDAIINGDVSIAVVPEPALSASFTARAASGKSAYTVVTNLLNVWNSKIETPMSMGCIVANGEFISEHKELVDEFLIEYEASIEFVSDFANLDTAANYIANASILPNAKIAKSALSNLGSSIAYIDGASMKNALKAFYTIINVTAPGDAFFYEK